MKNEITINIDTERPDQLRLLKPDNNSIPTNVEELKKSILTDISTLCSALIQLIYVSEQNGFIEREKLVAVTIKQLQDSLLIPINKEKPLEDNK